MNCIFDLDGVVCDIYRDILQARQDECQALSETQYDDLSDYDVWKFMNFSSADQYLNYIIENKILQSASVVEHSALVMDQLKKDGFNIHVVTARGFHPDAESVTLKWLHDNDLAFDRLSICSGSKAHVFNSLSRPYEFMIDDHIQHVADAHRSRLIRLPLLMSQPWNISQRKGLQTVLTIPDLLREVYN